jgi:phosphatidylglycerol:prolipoprotein diacylglycerol transferase
MQQVLLRIPIRIQGWLPDGIPLYGFGAMLFLTFVAVFWLVGRRAQREGIRKEFVQDLAMWLFIGGIVGARLSSVMLEGVHWSQFFRIWDGGLILYGGIIGGVLAFLVMYFRVIRGHGVSAWRLADMSAPCFALGICLGRIGCFLNGCCYGSVACPECPQVHFPFSSPPRFALVHDGFQTAAGFTMSTRAVDRPTVGVVDPASPAAQSGLEAGDVIVKVDGQPVASYRELWDKLIVNWPRGKNDLSLTVQRGNLEMDLPAFAPRTLGLHPTQLYESISMLLLLAVLLAYYPFRKNPGELIAIMMFGYGIHRTVNEILRDDPRPNQFEIYFSVLLIGLGLALWIWLRYLHHAKPDTIRLEPVATQS